MGMATDKDKPKRWTCLKLGAFWVVKDEYGINVSVKNSKRQAVVAACERAAEMGVRVSISESALTPPSEP